MTRQQRRNREYAAKCQRCRDGQRAGYAPSRSIVFGHAVWLHDGVHPCKAADLREKHWAEDHDPNPKPVAKVTRSRKRRAVAAR